MKKINKDAMKDVADNSADVFAKPELIAGLARILVKKQTPEMFYMSDFRVEDEIMKCNFVDKVGKKGTVELSAREMRRLRMFRAI